ncbi:hypothetical protein PPL_08347 [Heterostelium album PN500]|uniref:Uncharacterized protein n=1 Tax=Heterostelium pallidum (strain ATCC 26659 / Pp 5 / PN500) TaxID=670386 RepID=D3BHX9_HETP5|nr:hypothetical protein PPL_08347 [Heterostelium album PN500]EFA78879.1 hypothetical protein PPL_08347 [Heterostelium album PN500]|eukprot:XP_020431003.1 hypothetical protein PPL_08347 [Heterostelium album PN500]
MTQCIEHHKDLSLFCTVFNEIKIKDDNNIIDDKYKEKVTIDIDKLKDNKNNNIIAIAIIEGRTIQVDPDANEILVLTPMINVYYEDDLPKIYLFCQ